MGKTYTMGQVSEEEPKRGSGISFRLVSHALWRHPVAFAGVLVLAASAAAYVWYFLPLPKSTAAVVFHISSQSRAILSPTSENQVDFASYKQSQLALLKSRRTLNSALNAPEVSNLAMIEFAHPDELTWLDKALVIDPKSGAEFMRVTIEGDSEQELLALLTAVAKAYQKASHERDNGARIWRQDELEKALAASELELNKYKKRINEITEVIGGRDAAYLALNDRHRQDAFTKALDSHSLIHEEFTAARGQLESVKNTALRTALRTALPAVGGAVLVGAIPHPDSQLISPAAIEEELRRDPVMREFEIAIDRARQSLTEAEDRFQAGASQILAAKAALKSAEEKRDRYQKEARTVLEVQLRERAAQFDLGRMIKIQAECDQIKVRLDKAWRKVEEIKDEMKTAGLFKVELANLMAETAQTEKYVTAMKEEILRMKIELKSLSRVSLAEEPFIVPGIEGNRRKKYTLLTGLAVFFLGFSGLVAWQFRSRRVTHADEVSNDLGTRLIGTIPPLVTATRGSLANDAHAMMIEAIDTTRIMLTHGAENGSKLRVVVVTSAVSGEGKTTLSGHLAISLTRAGFRTLLIDGDMQAPSAHVLFGLADSPGLSELLRGDTSLQEAVRPSPIPGLWVLPAGKWTIATRQSLVGDRWRSLRAELEAEFDFIVIDTSPLLMVSDTMLLAREADGVVLSVLLGVSQIARVAETVNRLHAVGAELIGVVVNNVQSEVSSRYASRQKPAAPSVLPFGEPIDEVTATACGASKKG